MPEEGKRDRVLNPAKMRGSVLLLVSGAWTLPLLGIATWILRASLAIKLTVFILAVLVAPFPAFIMMSKQRRRLTACAAKSEEDAAQLKLQLDTVRYRTARLREELQAADRQARLSHQLTL